MHQGKPAGGHWVIWVIWVTVLNCMAMHAIGSFGSFILRDPNDLRAQIWRAFWVLGFGSFGSNCHRAKIGAGRGGGAPLQFTKGIPLYQNLLFS
jgi:hypothetical protein